MTPRPIAWPWIDASNPAGSRRRYTMQIGDREVTVTHMHEQHSLSEDAAVIGLWSNRFLEGSPAICQRKLDKGKVLGMGTCLIDALVEILDTKLIAGSSVEALLLDLPTGIEVS